jgi:hypothetical protein
MGAQAHAHLCVWLCVAVLGMFSIMSDHLAPVRHFTLGEIERVLAAGPSWLDLQRIVDLQTAATLRGVSPDTLERHCRDQILQLSPRRRGMRLVDALLLKKAS